MSKFEKAKERIRTKKSGSRVKFYREEDQKVILLHKPHPGDIMKPGAVKDLLEFLLDLGEL